VRYVAIQDWVESRGTTPYFSSVFDPAVTDYYGWTIPKDDHLIVGAAQPPRDRTLERFELLRQRLVEWGFPLGRTVRRESAMVLRPMSTRRTSTGTDRVALLGEAAGWISPSSAEGFSYAMRSAVALADALLPGIDGFHRRYRHATAALRRDIRLKTIKSRVVFSPLLRGLIMRLGIGSMDVRGE
jgi:flavin-dependent dehydrogenase